MNCDGLLDGEEQQFTGKKLKKFAGPSLLFICRFMDAIHIDLLIHLFIFSICRQSHKTFFDKSDLFFVCLLRPISFDISVQEAEIEAAQVSNPLWITLRQFNNNT